MNCRVYCIQMLLAVILFGVQELVYCQVEYSHHELPKLYTFDDYDLCFEKGNTKLSSTYCMVYAEIKPENSSELWQKITSHMNENKFHYHHDRLFFGICMERCNKFAQTAGNKSFHNDELLNNEITQHFELVHKRPLDIEMRTKYGAMIHNCLNEDFEAKYHLKLRTFVEYCETSPENSSVEKDPAESLLYTILKIFGLLTILSSIYDYYSKSQQPEVKQTNDFYKNNLEEPLSGLLTSFSICRNYYRIMQPYRGEIAKDFRYLDGFRSMTMLMVVIGHTIFVQHLHLKNPEYFEEMVKTPIGLMLSNASTIIEIFMVISGLLLSIKFIEGRYVTPLTTWKECVIMYMLNIFYRLLRLLPTVALSLLINASVFHRFADGPFWRHVTEPYRLFSRENWWKNILMFNNISKKDTANFHTWFIASNFQLYAFYTMILMFTAKYPQYKKRIFTTVAILAVAVPTLIAYVSKAEAIITVTGESLRYTFFLDSSINYYHIYTAFYTNLGGYLFGIICGEWYLESRRCEKMRKKVRSVFKYGLEYIIIPVAAMILYVGARLFSNEPSIWTALCNGLYRNLWIVFVCGIPLVFFLVCEKGNILYEFCCLPVFRVLGRLSFQMYLWHIQILVLLNASFRTPFYMTTLYIFGQGFLTLTSSMIVAFFVCLLVEFPIAQCLNSLTPRRNKTIDTKMCPEHSTNQSKVQ